MSNLKNNFTSKLTAVVKTSSKKGFVYTASFADGTNGVIRTSNREYVSVTQINAGYENGRTDFLFSSKPTASLGKNELDRVIATVQVTSEPTDKELAAYQPKIVTDAITNALPAKSEQLKAVQELYKYDHAFLGEEGAQELAKPFGLKARTYVAYANPNDPKGLTLDDGDKSARGIAAHDLAMQICDHLGVSYSSKFGRGSQLRACLEALEQSLKA